MADRRDDRSIDGRRSSDQARRRRESILQAALACLTEQGYESTTVSAIGARSGASVGSLYHFFPGGKPAIAAAVHLDAQARYQHELLPVLDGAGPEAGIRAGVAFHLRWVRQNPDRARFLFTDHPVEVDRAVGPGLEALNREFFGRLGDWVQGHVAAGALRSLPFSTFVAIWIGPAHHLARQRLLSNTASSLDRSAPALADAAWRSLAGPNLP